jgi:hypothetical protein
MTLSACVTSGAAILDKKKPTWFKKIDLETLDIGKPKFCVLGQLYGGYRLGISRLKIKDPAVLGFDLELEDNVDNEDDAEMFRQLTSLWIYAIRAKRLESFAKK